MSAKSAPNEVIEQAGALCLRTSPDGGRSVLLVGSRRNGRWGLPKVHIDPGEASHEAAIREAFEEAGVVGTSDDTIVGSFIYAKDSSPHLYRVIVHTVDVRELYDSYPEHNARQRRWFFIKETAAVVVHDGLRELFEKLRK